MELKIRRGISKTVITTTDKEPLFIIKNKTFSIHERMILRPHGTPVYSIKKDPKPLDRRDKYIFTDYSSGNEFYAWVDNDIFRPRGAVPFYRYFISVPVGIFIEAESFFGELCIKRSGISGFDILINDRKRGRITNKSISCDTIDDAGLLAVLYVFSNYISNSEERYRIADCV